MALGIGFQPVANLFLGLQDWKQRPRLTNPVHRGCHGYLPEHASERGFLLHSGPEAVELREEVELVDLAPTVLQLVGVPVPERMSGRSAARERS